MGSVHRRRMGVPDRMVWRRRDLGPGGPHRADDGQATVELALVLPVLFGLVLVLVQAGLVLRDQVLAVHAAREAARVAAIDGDDAAAVAAGGGATGLDPARLTVRIEHRGSLVVADVRYRSPLAIPLLSRVLREVDVGATVAMHDERSLDEGAVP